MYERRILLKTVLLVSYSRTSGRSSEVRLRTRLSLAQNLISALTKRVMPDLNGHPLMRTMKVCIFRKRWSDTRSVLDIILSVFWLIPYTVTVETADTVRPMESGYSDQNLEDHARQQRRLTGYWSIRIIRIVSRLKECSAWQNVAMA